MKKQNRKRTVLIISLIFLLFLVLLTPQFRNLIGFLLLTEKTANKCEWQPTSIEYISQMEGKNSEIITFNNASHNKAEISFKNDSVIMDTDSSANARIKFAAFFTQTPRIFYFAHDNDTGENSVRAILATSNNELIHVIENEPVKINELFVAEADEGYGRIFYLDNLSVTNSISDYVILREWISAERYTVKAYAVGCALFTIDGKEYYLKLNENSIQVTYGQDAACGNAGKAINMPKIKLTNGNSIAFTTLDIIRKNYRIDVSGSSPAILFFENSDDSAVILIPVTSKQMSNSLEIAIGKPYFIRGKCVSEIPVSKIAGKYQLTCEKLYSFGWHATKCDSKVCEGNIMKECETKKSFFRFRTSYREICMTQETSACEENSSCPDGFSEISRTIC